MKKLGLFMLGLALLLSPPLSAADAPQKFAVHPAPKSLPEIQFQDSEGRTFTLADFRGKLVLLNLWAAWCLPCRHEMPTLDRLQAELGGPDFQVLALSMDRGGFEAITKFYGEVGVKHLALDGSTEAASTLGAVGLPTTLLIDRDGREIGRLVGPAEWDSPDMVTFIRSYLPKQSGLGEPAARSANANSGSSQQLSAPRTSNSLSTTQGIEP
jgi:thiol-disulfide isomerase/thioredoxin